MCGIAGIYGFAEGSGTWIREMARALAHRGPDATGLHEAPGIAMAHLRLSILDTSARGNQPMHSPDGRYTLLHNGEIYNYKEIRSLLPGHRFVTETDSEVILAAYAAWGADCLQHFNGMFAFAIWDRQREELFVARDRLGIKPLYLAESRGQLAFASEVRSLLQLPWVNRKVDRNGLACYLTYQTVYGTGTLVEGIRELAPGHALLANHNGTTEFAWWSMDRLPEIPESREEILLGIRERLSAAVERRLISDVPLGAFLSGGIDSSAIVALMARASEQPVDTFSVVFEEKEYDESAFSEMIARKYRTRHHPIMLRPSDFLDQLPLALQAMDHPSGDGINSYVVSGMTRRQGIKVALSGLGGDELFAGYPVFTGIPGIQGKSVWKLPFFLRKMLRWAYRMLREGREADKIRQLLALPTPDWQAIYRIYRTIYRWDQATALTAGQLDHPLSVSFGQPYSEGHLLSEISRAEMGTYTRSVLLRDMDQMSMAHALEARVPFFDHELVEYVLAIPDAVKWPAYPKQLLVEAMGDLLPQEVVHRPKMGFVFPWEMWLRGPLKSFCAARMANLADRKLLDPTTLNKVWSEFQEGRGPWLWTHVWLPVVLEEWLERNLDN